METQSAPKSTNVLALERTDWALSRTRLAAERTMMAVLRTGLSFISFGFTIFKFLEYVQEREGQRFPLKVQAPRNMGLVLIGIGLFVLAAGSWQHWQFLKQLKTEADHELPWSVPLAGSLILGLFGLGTFVMLLIRLGPLSN